MSQLDFDQQRWLVEQLSNQGREVAHEQLNAAMQLSRPCVVFKPRLLRDGNAWIALLGDNIQEGVCGSGETPARAMDAFDKAWRIDTGSFNHGT